MCIRDRSQALSAQFTLKMCVAVQNREKITNNPYFEGSRSFKVVDLDVNRKGVWDFLLVINTNLGPTSHRFLDTATYWLEMSIFLYPPSHLAPLIRVSPFEFREKLYGS